MTFRFFAFALVGLLLLSLPARAGDGSRGEPVRVEYSAQEGCPGKQTFEAELTLHLGTDTFARFGELARTLSVTIQSTPEGFRARVELLDRQGVRAEREISAATCEQAARAIALVAALAARSQIERSEREREDEAAAATATPPRPEPPAAAAEPRLRTPPSIERPRSVARREPAFSTGLSAGAAASTGVGPRVAPGLLVALRLALLGTEERSLVLSALGFDTFRSSLDVADVRFSVLKARLELCPVEPRVAPRVFVSACAGFELGSQTGRSYADGVRVQTPRSASEPWMAATLAGRVGLRFGAVAVAMGPELGLPVLRNGFALVRPDRLVYRVPGATAAFSATAGLAW